MRFGVVAKVDKKEAVVTAKKVVDFLSKKAEVVVEEKLGKKIGEKGLTLKKMKADIMVTVGGDGTILRTLQSCNVPVFGINAGAVGFLTEAKPDTKFDNSPEPNTRFEMWQNIFKAQLEIDKYYPHLPTLMDRRFKEDREIPEEQFEDLLKSILSSPLIKQTGEVIEKRLGRKLKPFDIWYNGFKAQGKYNEAELDKIVKAKYPNVTAFEKDIPNILTKLSFSFDMAQFLASKIEVDAARGSGHAMAAVHFAGCRTQRL